MYYYMYPFFCEKINKYRFGFWYKSLLYLLLINTILS